MVWMETQFGYVFCADDAYGDGSYDYENDDDEIE